MKKPLRLMFLLLLPLLSEVVEAKKYSFTIDNPREVYVSRSTVAGTKMVKVVAYGHSADAAINQAMMDAVVALTFDGAEGIGEMESCPAILYGGRDSYNQNRIFFDRFFKKGDFLKYVEKVNSGYPTGADNMQTSRGRRIQIQLIVDWKGLAYYYKEVGLKTAISELRIF